MDGERIDYGLWLGHMALALAFWPLMMLFDSVGLPELAMWVVGGGYVLAPVLGYRWTLRGTYGPVPVEGPCQRTGSQGRWHWFEWGERPGVRWWTRDPAIADRLRAQRESLPQGGLDLSMRTGPDPRALYQLDRMTRNLKATSGGLLTGYFTLVAWLGLTGGLETGFAGFVVSSLACIPVSLLPLLVSMWLFYWAPFFAGWWSWHRWVVPSRAGTLRWNGPQLHTEQGTVYLDEPGTKVELAYGRFGTALVVDDGSQRVALHGDHAMLAPLADALQERVDGADTTDEEVERAAAWTRRLRSRVAEGT